jgi:hypothetical protein
MLSARTAFCAASLALAAPLISLHPRAAAQEDEIPWRSDLEAARREAATAGRPLFIVFR